MQFLFSKIELHKLILSYIIYVAYILISELSVYLERTNMKHIFIINPVAGKGKMQHDIIKKVEYEIYITKFKGDAKGFIMSRCEENIPCIFYACGGDGTLHEVINAVYPYKHVVVGHIPCGTGNDFVKNFENLSNFNNIDAQINGESSYIDLIKVKDKFAVSVCNIGIDADAAFNMARFKKIPFINGSTCYILAVLYCLLKSIGKNFNMEFDGCEKLSGKFLLGVIANGNSYGGGYKCAPLAGINDGIIDICLIKKVSRLKILNLMSIYKSGDHLRNEAIKQYVTYKKHKKIFIKSNEPINLCVDGEKYTYDELDFEIESNALKFWIPYGSRICNAGYSEAVN